MPSARNGRSLTVPLANTVSRWPSSSTWSLAPLAAAPLAGGTVAGRKKPALGWSVTSQAMPRDSRCARRSSPTRSTPALSSEPESVSTSFASSSTMGSYWASSQASSCASRAVNGIGVLPQGVGAILHQSPPVTRGRDRRTARSRCRCAPRTSPSGWLGSTRLEKPQGSCGSRVPSVFLVRAMRKDAAETARPVATMRHHAPICVTGALPAPRGAMPAGIRFARFVCAAAHRKISGILRLLGSLGILVRTVWLATAVVRKGLLTLTR